LRNILNYFNLLWGWHGQQHFCKLNVNKILSNDMSKEILEGFNVCTDEGEVRVVEEEECDVAFFLSTKINEVWEYFDYHFIR